MMVAAMEGADQQIRSSLGFSIVPKDISFSSNIIQIAKPGGVNRNSPV